MTILVAFESSGRIRQAFRDRGHDAWSCDLLKAVDGSPFHLQVDALEAIRSRQWDLIIMHPTCRALCVSGNRYYGKGMAKHDERIAAIKSTMALWELARQHAARVCMENPVGVLPIKPTQYIQPYEYGHNESKKTGLWLHGLPKLQPTKFVPMPECGYRENQTPSGQNKLGPSADRWRKRSETYAGIAQAMSQQWSAGLPA